MSTRNACIEERVGGASLAVGVRIGHLRINHLRIVLGPIGANCFKISNLDTKTNVHFLSSNVLSSKLFGRQEEFVFQSSPVMF